jgi:hypothetical protein
MNIPDENLPQDREPPATQADLSPELLTLQKRAFLKRLVQIQRRQRSAQMQAALAEEPEEPPAASNG